MNDTILNDRQKKILEILQGSGGLSRLELAGLISFNKPVSKITLIRDINTLIKAGLILAEGKGRYTSYFIPITNPLLEYVDIDSYFSKEVDNRNARNNFNVNVFDNLTNLFTDMCGNTILVNRGDQDIPWLYQELSKKESKENEISPGSTKEAKSKMLPKNISNKLEDYFLGDIQKELMPSLRDLSAAQGETGAPFVSSAVSYINSGNPYVILPIRKMEESERESILNKTSDCDKSKNEQEAV